MIIIKTKGPLTMTRRLFWFICNVIIVIPTKPFHVFNIFFVMKTIYTAMPNQNENAKTTAPSNFDAEAFGDMFSTLYNRIWTSANSFFRNNRVRPFFACLLELWLTYSPQCSLNWSVLQNLILNLNMEQKTKHKFFMLLCKKMKNKGISKIEFWPL